MESLLYTSEPTGGCDETAVAEILDAALRNNPGLGLTGMLLWSEHMFAQLLEGPAASLDFLLGRLRADRRHRNMTVMFRSPVADRFFPEWSMASRRIQPDAPWGELDVAKGGGEANAVWVLQLMAECRRGGVIAAPPPTAVQAGSPS